MLTSSGSGLPPDPGLGCSEVVGPFYGPVPVTALDLV